MGSVGVLAAGAEKYRWHTSRGKSIWIGLVGLSRRGSHLCSSIGSTRHCPHVGPRFGVTRRPHGLFIHDRS